ncbi:MAG: hypothetical protein AB2L07_21600 [Thermoanaerobaculaceae bacterium]
MISEDDYARDCLDGGIKGHFHDGVWWRQVFPGYAKPMFEYRTLPAGSARPNRRRALLGFSHLIPEGTCGNSSVTCMVLQGPQLRGFDLGSLPGKKRNQVRKGLKHCVVSKLENLDRHLEEIREIYISQSLRHTEHHERPDTPPSFYAEHAAQWRARELRYLTTCGRETWGAFVDGSLVGFVVTAQVGSTELIEKVKCRTEYLQANVVDAMYFIVLGEAARNPECIRVINPGIRGGRLARHKEQFLFKLTALPAFTSSPWILWAARRAQWVVSRVRHPRQLWPTRVARLRPEE